MDSANRRSIYCRRLLAKHNQICDSKGIVYYRLLLHHDGHEKSL